MGRGRRDIARGKPPRRMACLPLLALILLVASGQARAQMQEPSPWSTCAAPDSLTRALERIARRVSGEIGIAAIHLESGMTVSVNGDRRFPMASVSKVPMALVFLRRVDAGELSMDERLVLPITDFRPGNSPLASWSGGRPTFQLDRHFNANQSDEVQGVKALGNDMAWSASCGASRPASGDSIAGALGHGAIPS